MKREIEEIKQSEARLRQIIDTIPALVWCGLPDGSKEFFNQRWYDYTGLSPEEAHGWRWKAPIHPEDLEKFEDAWLKFVASGEAGEVEARIRRHDYSVNIAGGFGAAQLTSDYVTANGIRLPTKRRAYTRGLDRRPIPEMLMVSIDLSEIRYE